jgi:hypothetical protein
MTIETVGIPGQLLAEYAAVSIAFEVTSVLSPQKGTDQLFALTERRLDSPYVKDYDAIGDRPWDWAARFHTSQWVQFLARDEGQNLGGATIAFGTSGLDMLEDRTDLAVIWDIRIAPALRGRGGYPGETRGGVLLSLAGILVAKPYLRVALPTRSVVCLAAFFWVY